MVNFEKSQPAPGCLEVEKNKAFGDYKCGDVLERLQGDFKNKCYLCEQKAPPSINVEHFKSHQGDKDLKFDWANLFWSCSHCNNLKLHLYDDILNCIDPAHLVDGWIKYKINPFPKEKAEISALIPDEKVEKTVELLNKIFNGSTPLKKIEAANIRQNLVLEIRKFQNLLFEYFDEENENEYKEKLRNQIRQHLESSSNFTAFKRWVIKDNESLKNEFLHLFS